MEIDKMYAEICGGGADKDNGKAVGLRGGATARFLLKIFEMVEDPKTNSLISWSSNNMSFVIWDHNKFAAELLPKYFKHSNMSSFIYQLNNYGFRKVHSGMHEYENEWFRPGKKHWLKSIRSRVQKLKTEGKNGRIIDLEKGDVDVEMEKLRAEQLTIKLEIQKLKEQLEDMEKEFSRFQEPENGDNGDDDEEEERIISSFSLEFIELVKEKTNVVEVEKKRKIGANSGCVEKKKKGDEELAGETEKTAVEGKMEENARNVEFWKKMFEEDSDEENDGGEGEKKQEALQNSKIMGELDDLMASNIIAMEGERLMVSMFAGLDGEEDEAQAHLQLWT